MNVLTLKTSGRLKATQIYAQKNNEIYPSDIKKLLSNNIDTVYATKISRLAYLYIMFVEKNAAGRPVNQIASQLVNEDEGIIRGDAVIARTNHFGTNSKIFTLEDSEAKDVAERISKIAKTKIEVAFK